jgi:hypothetical protein
MHLLETSLRHSQVGHHILSDSRKLPENAFDLRASLASILIGVFQVHRYLLRTPNARPQLRLEAEATEEHSCRPMIMMEASPLAYPRGMLTLGIQHWLTRRRPQAILHQPTPILLWY